MKILGNESMTNFPNCARKTVAKMVNEKRLIDANEYPCQNCYVSYCYKNCEKFNAWLEKTVDAVEVVHGRWVVEKRHTVSSNPYMDDNYHAHATCSECNFCIHSENASFVYPKLNTTNYCPNCGAKMRGSEE